MTYGPAHRNPNTLSYRIFEAVASDPAPTGGAYVSRVPAMLPDDDPKAVRVQIARMLKSSVLIDVSTAMESQRVATFESPVGRRALEGKWIGAGA